MMLLACSCSICDTFLRLELKNGFTRRNLL
jgi:hypothetical protein